MQVDCPTPKKSNPNRHLRKYSSLIVEIVPRVTEEIPWPVPESGCVQRKCVVL